jgi:hypothetical protein
MKTLIGIGIILFAILLQMCSTGIELMTLGLGLVGVLITIFFAVKSE